MHWVVVGTGNISKRHRENIKYLWPDALVTALIPHRKKAQKDQNLNHADYLDDDHDTVLEKKPDAVIIATPASSHIDEAIFWLKHDIPVFIEKPLAMSAKQAKNLQPFASNSIITVGYVLRFLPIIRELKEIIQSNSFGKIISLEAHVGSYLPDWRPQNDYKKSVSARAELGGGALLELSHEIDYVLWFLGKPEKISATLKNSGTLDIEVEDDVDLEITFKGNLKANIHMDFLQSPPTRFCKVFFEEAIVKVDILTGTLQINKNNGEENIYNLAPKNSNAPYLGQLQNFYDTLKGTASPSVTIEDGVNVLSVIDTARQNDNI
jgi:predicted dehydrogenase